VQYDTLFYRFLSLYSATSYVGVIGWMSLYWTPKGDSILPVLAEAGITFIITSIYLIISFILLLVKGIKILCEKIDEKMKLIAHEPISAVEPPV
jgi:hypothetical protein